MFTPLFTNYYEDPNETLTPITGYKNLPLLPLADCLASIRKILHKDPYSQNAHIFDWNVLRIWADAALTKGQLLAPTDPYSLTEDEIASITLYTQDTNFYKFLNFYLRNENRDLIKPFFPYLNLLDCALTKLPVFTGSPTIYRGVNVDLLPLYANKLNTPIRISWWMINSCTSSLGVIDIFLGGNTKYTVFNIHATNGKEISRYSAIKRENEIILSPGSRFAVTGISKATNTVELREDPLELDIGYGIVKSINFIAQFGSEGKDKGKFSYPCFLSVSNFGKIFVSDYSNRIQVFDVNGKYLFHFGAGGGHGDGEFATPWSVKASKNGNVFVADFQNHRVQKFSSTGKFITKFGTFGNGNGEFNQPCGIIIDSKENIFVADSGNNRIQVFTSNGQFLRVFSDGIEIPSHLATDKDENVYVLTATNLILKYDPKGNFLGESVHLCGYAHSLNGFFLDDENNMVVSDMQTHQILVFDKNGNMKFQFGGEGKAQATFSTPGAIAVFEGKIFIVDMCNHRVQVFGTK